MKNKEKDHIEALNPKLNKLYNDFEYFNKISEEINNRILYKNNNIDIIDKKILEKSMINNGSKMQSNIITKLKWKKIMKSKK